MNLSQSIDKFAYSLLEKFFEIGCVSHQDGYTIIEKATFRPAAFDTLDLPCAIREGYIETIKYRLDIDNLKADLLSIQCADMYLDVCDLRSADKTEPDGNSGKVLSAVQLESDHVSRTERLREYLQPSVYRAYKMAVEGIVTKVAGRMLQNLSIDVRRVHVRHYNDTPNQDEQGVLGIFFESLSLVPESIGREADGEDGRRHISLIGGQAYWLPRDAALAAGSAASKPAAARCAVPPDARRLLLPCNAEARVLLSRGPDEQSVLAEITVPSVTVAALLAPAKKRCNVQIVL